MESQLASQTDIFSHLREILILFAIAGVVVPLFSRLRLSSVLGYLFMGLAISPYALGTLAAREPWLDSLLIDDAALIGTLSELGVVFLLFMIGLELSFRRLWEMRRLVLGLGGLQILLTASVIAFIAREFGNSAQVAVLIGASMALSSTAIVIQLLRDGGRLATPIGRICFSILLMQDLAVMPILALISALKDESSGIASALGEAMITALIAVAGIYLLGRFLLRPLLRTLGAARNTEGFFSLVLLLVIGAAGITHGAGLSAALGAFLAGLLIAETEYRHEVEVMMDPLRGLLLGVFFLSVGMSIDVTEVLRQPTELAMGVFGLLAIKSVILLLLGLAFSLPVAKAIEVALLLGQTGEFALVIISLALAAGLINGPGAQYFLLLTALSMMFTPVIAWLARQLTRKLQQRGLELPAWLAHHEESKLENHLIIAGFGRVGMMLGQVLESHRLSYVAIDQDTQRASALRDLTFPVYYGDARRPELWERLHAESANAVLITIDNPQAAREMLQVVRKHWPLLPVIMRARDVKDIDNLYALGATMVIPEILESSLQMARHMLHTLGVPEHEIEQTILEYREMRLPYEAAAPDAKHP